MGALYFFSVVYGAVVGSIFSLLYVSFDADWKKIVSFILPTGSGGLGILALLNKYNITDINVIFISAGAFFFSFLVVFIIFLLVLCKIIKDKDDKDILRIRDIILGQKNYIEKYYEKRIQDIDAKLNISELEKREEQLSSKEDHLRAELEAFDREKEAFSKLSEKKLQIKLPESKNLVVTKEFLDLLPSYVEELSAFIDGIQKETDLFLSEHDTASLNDLKVYFTLLSIHILDHLFGNGSIKDVRVHFRCYDEDKNGYKRLVSVIGRKEYKRDMTFIPYDKANMIMRSFECKRALIKSYNLQYDFTGNNNTTWTEYMTGTFYNITKDGIPCLSFGISVKNATKYKNLFIFLNYCKFESYLQDVIEQIDDRYSIATILYSNN